MNQITEKEALLKQIQVPENTMILGDGIYYDLDTYKTMRNNNVVVIGSPGSCKTRGIIIPNILQASGSYVITDPKGNLYEKYHRYLRRKGYVVKAIDFMDAQKSIGYNCIAKVETEDEISSLAHTIIYSSRDMSRFYGDLFWNESGELLLTALLCFVRFYCETNEWTFSSIVKLLNAGNVGEDYSDMTTKLDQLFADVAKVAPSSMAVRKYNAFRVAASRTLKSIIITLQSTIGAFDTPSVQSVMERRDELNIADIGKRKTAVFITVSDTDRRLDGLVNIVFTQIMQSLVKAADHSPGQHLPIPVRFLMDDFATNVTLTDFPRMIASIRSRWISTMLILQAEAQLKERYGEDGRTILGSCDTYVYLGGEDIETAQNVSLRADKSLKEILEMPLGTGLIFRRGDKMVKSRTFPLEEFERTLRSKSRKEISHDEIGYAN